MTEQTISGSGRDTAPKTYKQGDYFLTEQNDLVRLCQTDWGRKMALISEGGNRCLDSIIVEDTQAVTVQELSKMTERTLTPVKSVDITYTV